jgi:hypothetical protein
LWDELLDNYMMGVLVVLIDPKGLVKWKGDFNYAGVDADLGGIGFSFHLVSECVNNVAYYVNIRAIAFQVAVGLPVGVGLSGPWDKFMVSDTSSEPNPDSLAGIFNFTSAGYVIFDNSTGYIEMQLGQGHGSYTGDMQGGIDVGMSAGAGTSYVKTQERMDFKDQCECERWNREQFGEQQ